MDVYGARQFVIVALQSLLAATVNSKAIEPHRGQFASLEEIRNIALRSPAVRVAFRGLQGADRQGPELIADVLWSIHIIANDTRAEARNTLAGGVAVTVLDHIVAEAPHWPFVEGGAEQATAIDLTTLELDKNGVSLWQVSWRQQCRLQLIDPLSGLDDFGGFDADHFAPDNTDSAPLAQTHADYCREI